MIVINTCSVRERAEEKLYTRLGELRVLEEETGHRPVVAVAGCVAQQEGQALLRKSTGHVIDVVIGTQQLKMLPVLVANAAQSATAEVNINPLGRRDVSTRNHAPQRSTSRRTSPSSKAATTTARSAWCRTRAGTSACAPRPTSWPTCATPSTTGRKEIQLLGQIVNHYQAPDDPACDFAQLLEDVNDIPGVERIRFASPHPRHTGARLIDAVRDAAEGL